MVHFLDLMGADLDSGRGKLSNTPLMAATMRWNTRVVEYLIARNADPFSKDKYGFTCLQKALIKNLQTIGSMLSHHETNFNPENRFKLAITN